jgi:hypothetical protein
MIAYFLGPDLGMGAVALTLTIAEGLALSVVIAVLTERYLFPMLRD